MRGKSKDGIKASGGKFKGTIKAKAEIKKLNRMANRAMKKDTLEHKKIFDTHTNAWKELANK
jgi:hypothetical protein